MTARYNHDYYVEYLRTHLHLIGEYQKKLKYLIDSLKVFGRDGKMTTMCDLIGVYYNNTCFVAELKGSAHKLGKAKSQLAAGRKFAIEDLCIQPALISMKFVLYTPNGYETTIVTPKLEDII